MKSISLLGLGLFLFGSSAVESHAADVKVLLIGGQSNALGRAPVSGLPLALQGVQSDVMFFGGSDGTVGTTLTVLQPDGKNSNEFGPEVTFGRSIADTSPTTQFALIKYAAGGTALYNDWAPGTGAEYTAFRNTVTAGLAALQAAGHTTEILGMVWHQGESDAIENQQANYASNLAAFITDIRANYGTDLPFLIGEIRRSNGTKFVTVADAQIAVAAADPNSIFVPASDLSFLDIYHFDAPSMITLGERFAAGYTSLTGGAGDSTPPILSPSSIVDDLGGGTISPGATLTYTISFSEDIDETTVSNTDFDNAGSAAVTIGAIVEISPGVFTVVVTADTTGTLQLRVPVSASIADVAGNLLDSDPAIVDDTTLTISEAPDPWISGVSIEAVSSQFAVNRSADNIINGNGFTESSGFHSSAGGDNISWTSEASSSDPLPHFVTLDLGANYNLDFVKIWNWNTTNTLTASAKDIDISVADTVGGSFVLLGSFILDIGPGQNSVDFGQVIDLSSFNAADDVRLVRIDIKSNHGWVHATFPGLVGLSEVRFSGITSPSNTFATWISSPTFGLQPAQQGFDLDPDADGIPNGVEAWMGTHPGEFNASLATIATDGITTAFTHPTSDTPLEDLSVSYEWSQNLTNWYGTGNGPSGGATVDFTASTVNGTTTVTANASTPMIRWFTRVRVDQVIP